MASLVYDLDKVRHRLTVACYYPLCKWKVLESNRESSALWRFILFVAVNIKICI
jgi:hypothetical protein